MLSRPAQYEPLRTSHSPIVDDTSLSILHAKRRVIEPVLNSVTAIWGRCTELVRVNAGLLLVAASQAFFALMNVAVKKLNSLDPPVPALELVFVRMGITYICCLSYLLWRKVPDPILGPKGVRHLLAIRGFTGFFGLFGVYYSLQYLSLSDATVLTFLAPLTTAVAGYFFLGEAFHRREALAGLMSMVGVVLIARPEAIFGSRSSSSSSHSPPVASDVVNPDENVTPGQRLGAVGVALLGVLGATGAYTSMRAIGKRAHTLHSMSYFSLWCVITSTTGMILLGQKVVLPTRLEWLALLLMIGIFGFLAQALLTMGLQRETAGRGSLAIYVQIIYATILERMFFHTVPSALSIVGTMIIMGSAVYVALTKKTTKTSESAESEAATASAAAFDLELGGVSVSAARRDDPYHHILPQGRVEGDYWQRFAQTNVSRTLGGGGGGGGVAIGVGAVDGMKSDLSLTCGFGELLDEKEKRRGEEEEREEGEETCFAIASPSSSSSLSPSSGSETRVGGDEDEDEDAVSNDDGDEEDDEDDGIIDEDRRRLLKGGSGR
ncbi:hypothetical protein ACEPAH_9399 [Sanghuangporus vaninii]